MRTSLRALVAAGGLAACLASAPWAFGRPEPETSPAKPSGPAAPDVTVADLRDPAFDRYADLALLGRAWAELNPELMADVGLQLQEGERILLRPRKGLSADEVLGMAAQLASEKGDKATLDRLAKAADRSGDQGLAARVASAQKLASAARDADPALSVSVETTAPDDFALYQAYCQDVRAARLVGDAHGLDQIDKELSDTKAMPPAHVAALKKLTAAARDALPRKDPGESPKPGTKLAHTLGLLANASRDGWLQQAVDDTSSDLANFDQNRLGWGQPQQTYSTFDDPQSPPAPRPAPTGPALGTYQAGRPAPLTDYQRRQFAQQYGQARPRLYRSIPHH